MAVSWRLAAEATATATPTPTMGAAHQWLTDALRTHLHEPPDRHERTRTGPPAPHPRLPGS
ncbi:hypothetical protein [Streptomyces sp. CC210A]|uniref:hypothetical protein n=1 Tax=Streptomyces sp. CC210A TaxID=2898184 RepID=UPI001F1850FA|nr:hypothetical protein [Streptomyces sp. CC210A]